jgi:uncharacterized protein YqjF (DUF2071 family)
MPVAQHEFLNVRTYVRVGADRGIYFIVEWVPNALAQWIGPRTYGLPYQFGRIKYVCRDRGAVCGDVQADGRFCFSASRPAELAISDAGSLDGFLIERYTAFTCRHGILRRFRIAHAPWAVGEVRCEIEDDSLVARAPWWREACFAGAHYSPGVADVEIGMPQRVAQRW